MQSLPLSTQFHRISTRMDKRKTYLCSLKFSISEYAGSHTCRENIPGSRTIGPSTAYLRHICKSSFSSTVYFKDRHNIYRYTEKIMFSHTWGQNQSIFPSLSPAALAKCIWEPFLSHCAFLLLLFIRFFMYSLIYARLFFLTKTQGPSTSSVSKLIF